MSQVVPTETVGASFGTEIPTLQIILVYDSVVLKCTLRRGTRSHPRVLVPHGIFDFMLWRACSAQRFRASRDASHSRAQKKQFILPFLSDSPCHHHRVTTHFHGMCSRSSCLAFCCGLNDLRGHTHAHTQFHPLESFGRWNWRKFHEHDLCLCLFSMRLTFGRDKHRLEQQGTKEIPTPSRIAHGWVEICGAAWKPKPNVCTTSMNHLSIRCAAERPHNHWAHSLIKSSHGLNTCSWHCSCGPPQPKLTVIAVPDGDPDVPWVRLSTNRGHLFHPAPLPHERVGAIFSYKKFVCDRQGRGPAHATLECWSAMCNMPIVQNQPSSPGNAYRILSMGLHGHGTVFSNPIPWYSLCGSLCGGGFSERFSLSAVRKADVCDATLD